MDYTVGEEYVSVEKDRDTMDETNDDGGNRNDYTHGATDDKNQDHRDGVNMGGDKEMESGEDDSKCGEMTAMTMRWAM